MLNTVIVGASGYTGAELAKMVNRHSQLNLSRLYVSKNSLDAGKKLASLYGELSGIVDLKLEGLDPADIPSLFGEVDVVLLATAHEVSHDIAQALLDCSCIVFDLSGAFRVPNLEFYQQFYGFEHRYPALLEQAVYGLAEHNAQQVKQTRLIAVPGCYTTAALTALKPLANANLISEQHKPVINATSGVSGAGRKASMGSSFCEVSLQPYGVFNHRHQPEIVHHLGTEVIFTPHLGSYKRGILATMNVVLKPGTSSQTVTQAFQDAYQDKPIVRLSDGAWPKLQNVVNTPFLDLAWQQQGDDLIVVSAEDNLLKGAASQAMQCINIRFGFDMMESLL